MIAQGATAHVEFSGLGGGMAGDEQRRIPQCAARTKVEGCRTPRYDASQEDDALAGEWPRL